MKSSCNSINLILITLSFLLFFTFNFPNVFAAPTRHLCHPEQRDAILAFQNEFEIQKPCSLNFSTSSLYGFPKTESWANNSDCCSWDGIRCDANFSDVIELKLKHSCLHGQLNSKSNIFRLQNLRFLDLSGNNFSGEIPSSLGNLSHLTTLDLSGNSFNGEIPSSLGNLSHLTTLDLSENDFSGEIPSSIVNLSYLTSLYLSNNNFCGEIPSSLGNLSHLTTLGLSGNSFNGEIPSSLGNLSHLTTLDLSENDFSGEIPSSIVNLSYLTSLYLSNNNFCGEITFLGRLNQLVAGTLHPNISSSLPNLVSFDASHNAFIGTLPSSLFTIPSLIYINLVDNQLNGTLEFGNISSSSKIEIVLLGNNNFRGPIPKSISKLVKLGELDLSHFNTQGSVDFSIFSHFKSLWHLDLSHLNTTTAFDLNGILSRFKSLVTLDLSGSHVLATNKSSVSGPPLLFQLNLSGCGLTEFPEIIRTQHRMAYLDVSNNKIKGQVPGWLWTLPDLNFVDLSNNTFIGFEKLIRMPSRTQLQMTLDISNNNMKGQVPGWLWTLPNLQSVDLSKNSFTGFERSTKPGPSMRYLFGANNNFTGKVPSFICAFRSLVLLDLSNNKFSGSIPCCLGNFSSTLQVLNLRKNHLSGGLPENISASVKSLDIGHNQLVGRLPRSLVSISFLEVLNMESNRINDTFPFWLSSLHELQVLVLRSNAFHGPIQQTRFSKLRIIDISSNHFYGTLPSDCFANWTAMFSLEKNEDQSNGGYMGTSYYSDSMVLMNKGVEMKLERILKIYTALDFSGNKFEGDIPKSIGLLKELHVLNLSNNAFTGHIPSSMANLGELESLDVSQNKLSGEIPQEIGSLSYLSCMNFSHNQLVGLVPGGTQFKTQPCSSFMDNLGLYGPSLEEICVDNHSKTSHQSVTPEPEEDEEEVISLVAAAIGFMPGIVFGLTLGYILVCYKPEWFKNPFGRNKRRSIATTH